MPLPPDAAVLQEARDWLARADEDLQVAELTLNASPALLGSSVYHSQQAARKRSRHSSRRARLPFHPTHDLAELQRQSCTIEAAFHGLRRRRR
jgi:HEPN domain-containing protein